jgi:acetoin utilization protein AcuB
MLVRHFMAREVFTLSPGQTCVDAYRAMWAQKLRRAPVVVDGKVVGMVSERDLLKRLPGTIAQAATEAGEKGMESSVRSVMSATVQTVAPNDPLEAAAKLMLKHKVGGIPVVERGRLAGIITESDIFRALWEVLASGRGTRIVLEESAAEGAKRIDLAKLCAEHGCRIGSLLHHVTKDGTLSTYLRIEAGATDRLTEAIWKAGCKVVSVEKR